MPTAQRERNGASVEAFRHAMAFANLASVVCFDHSTPTFGIRYSCPGGERKGALGFRSKHHACLAQLRQSFRSRRPSMVAGNGARHNKSGQYDRARDHNICGRRIPVLGSQARGGLANARHRAWRGSAEQRPQVRIRTPSSGFCGPCGTRLYLELPKRARHTVGHHLSYDGSPTRATPYLAHDTYLFDIGRGISHFAHRYEPSLPRCSLSHRCSWRLVHWRCLGDGLLGTDDMAPAGRSGRAPRPFVTAAQVGCLAVEEALCLALRNGITLDPTHASIESA